MFCRRQDLVVIDDDTYKMRLQETAFTYSLCGGLRSHAVFTYGQFESVFDACFQLGAGDSQDGAAGTQAEVQTGAMLRTLQIETRGALYLFIYLPVTQNDSVWIFKIKASKVNHDPLSHAVTNTSLRCMFE